MAALTQAEFEQILKDLRNNRVKHLDLGRKSLTTEQATVFFRVLTANTSISSADFRDNQIDAERAKKIIKALRSKNRLISINFFKNHIGDGGAIAIAEVLRNNERLLNSISNINIASNQIGDRGVIELSNVLKINRISTRMNLSDNQIGAEGVIAIADVLENSSSLISINLSWNQIGVQVVEIAKALRSNDSLIEINLCGSQIGDAEVEEISETLKINRTLTNIDLSWNQIGDEGAISIARALEVNWILTSIDLGSNQIGDEGAIALAGALRINHTLTSIDLGSNQIGDEGARAIVEALESNKTITRIGLWNNQISEELESQIEVLIERNCKIRDDFLELVKKAITDDSQQEDLKRMMQEDVTPIAHQSYALARIIEEASELSEKGQDIAQHLKMIESLMNSTALVSQEVVETVRNSNNPQISALFAVEQEALKAEEEQLIPSSTIETAHSSSVVRLSEMEEALERKKRQEEIARQEHAYAEIARLKETVAHLNSLKSRSASGTLTTQQISELNLAQNRIRSLESELRRVDERYKLSEQDLLERQHIANNPNLRTCSNLIENAFNVSFHAAITMSSQEFETQERNASRVVESASILASGVPIVSPLVLLALAATSAVTRASRSGQFKAISDLNPRSQISESERFSEKIAHILTISSQTEIKNIATGRDVEETRLQKIRETISQAAKIVRDSAQEAVATVSSSTARGLFGENYSSMQLLALDIANDALTYVMNQTPEELKQTQEEVSAGNYEAVIARIVENAIGRKPVRLSLEKEERQTDAKDSANRGTVSLVGKPSPKIVESDVMQLLMEQQKQIEELNKLNQEVTEKLEEFERNHKETQRELTKAEKRLGIFDNFIRSIIGGKSSNQGSGLMSVRKEDESTVVLQIEVDERYLEQQKLILEQILVHKDDIGNVENRISHVEAESKRRKQNSNGGCCIIS